MLTILEMNAIEGSSFPKEHIDNAFLIYSVKTDYWF
jgi:hypothetical protein